MSLFQGIVLLIYWQFATCYFLYVSDFTNVKGFFKFILLIVFAMTIGTLYFPALFAEDIYKKLYNKRDKT